jgi:hypothetical protein
VGQAVVGAKAADVVSRWLIYCRNTAPNHLLVVGRLPLSLTQRLINPLIPVDGEMAGDCSISH